MRQIFKLLLNRLFISKTSCKIEDNHFKWYLEHKETTRNVHKLSIASFGNTRHCSALERFRWKCCTDQLEFRDEYPWKNPNKIFLLELCLNFSQYSTLLITTKNIIDTLFTHIVRKNPEIYLYDCKYLYLTLMVIDYLHCQKAKEISIRISIWLLFSFSYSDPNSAYRFLMVLCYTLYQFDCFPWNYT